MAGLRPRRLTLRSMLLLQAALLVFALGLGWLDWALLAPRTADGAGTETAQGALGDEPIAPHLDRAPDLSRRAQPP
jgi:hypothetical protein